MEEPSSGTAPGQPVKRPVLLTVLCILTFMGCGLNMVSGLVIGLWYERLVPFAAEFGETYQVPGMEMITEGSPRFFFISALLYSGSIAGAFMMWQLRKTGFHLYTISQILVILAPMYFYKLPGPSLADLLLTGIFVILYSLNLKIMK